MKILILTSAYSMGFGVGLVIRKQVDALRSTWNHEIFVGLPVAKDASPEQGLVEAGSDAESVRKLICRLKPHVVIVHTPPYFRFVAQFDDFEIIKIAYDHGEPFPSLFKGEEVKLREQINEEKYRAIGAFHYHISISEFIKECSGINPSTVIYNGADHTEIESPSHIGSYSTLPEISEKTFLISMLARMGVGENHYKGFDLFCRLGKIVNSLLPEQDITFVVMGRSVPTGNPVVQMLRSEGVTVFENVSEQDKWNMLAHSGVYVSTSLWEGFDLPLVEAQYLGVPSAALSTGAHPEVCANHFQTLEELAHFIALLYKQPELRQFHAQAQQNFVKRKFRWSKNTAALTNFIEEAWSNKRSSLLGNTAADIPAKERVVQESMKRALYDHLKRNGLRASVEHSSVRHSFRIRYHVETAPLVSIIIPNHNHSDDLSVCIDSIYKRSTYKQFEILVVENNSNEPGIFGLYEKLEKTYPNLKVIEWNKLFNFAAVNNFAANASQGELLLFLNNDTEVITPGWMEEMLQFAVKPDVGAVGAKLYFPDGTIQHAGIVTGIRGVAGHIFRAWPGDSEGYWGMLKVARNVSAVTAACCMMRRDVFDEVKGFDERYILAFNDVDLCMKIRARGYQIIWTPYAELIHHETKTRGEEDTREKRMRFANEIRHFKKQWKNELEKGDPFYSPNLSTDNDDFNLNMKAYINKT